MQSESVTGKWVGYGEPLTADGEDRYMPTQSRGHGTRHVADDRSRGV